MLEVFEELGRRTPPPTCGRSTRVGGEWEGAGQGGSGLTVLVIVGCGISLVLTCVRWEAWRFPSEQGIDLT